MTQKIRKGKCCKCQRTPGNLSAEKVVKQLLKFSGTAERQAFLNLDFLKWSLLLSLFLRALVFYLKKANNILNRNSPVDWSRTKSLWLKRCCRFRKNANDTWGNLADQSKWLWLCILTAVMFVTEWLLADWKIESPRILTRMVSKGGEGSSGHGSVVTKVRSLASVVKDPELSEGGGRRLNSDPTWRCCDCGIGEQL